MNRCCVRILLLSLGLIALVPLALGGAGVTFQKGDGKVDILIDGKVFTTYYHASDQVKPYFHPLRAADGRVMTRAYPMDKSAPGEEKDRDHPHHRSCWYTHGDVNGVDYWGEAAKRQGKIVHRQIDKAEGGQTGVLATTMDWIDDTGKRVLVQSQEVRFQGDNSRRIMDFRITFTAGDQDVKFGDTKEGSFGVRLATPLKETNGGVITNSKGATGMKGCWGKAADWVDYAGALGGGKVGVAIMDHPTNPRYPTTWHVRDYGLFAVNPFGLHDFLNDPKQDGSLTIKKGESVTFKYRILIHEGDTGTAKIADEYKAYTSQVR